MEEAEMIKRVLVTGSNRGLGLEFVRQYLEDGWRVYATCRHPAEAIELQRLTQIYSQLSLHRLDITVQEDVYGIHQKMEGVPLDLLINNAGVYFERSNFSSDCTSYDIWRRTLEVNTIGTVRVIETLLENISLSKQDRLIVVISSDVGSIEESDQPASHYYRSSKAALNVAAQGLAAELKPRRIGILLLHPGEVITRMGNEEGISSHHSVASMRKQINSFSLEKSGCLQKYDGSLLALLNR